MIDDFRTEEPVRERVAEITCDGGATFPADAACPRCGATPDEFCKEAWYVGEA